jgi:hypothetical protein
MAAALMLTAGGLHPTWGTVEPAVDGYCRLLCFLVDEEVKRLKVWTDPISGANGYATTPSVSSGVTLGQEKGGGSRDEAWEV